MQQVICTDDGVVVPLSCVMPPVFTLDTSPATSDCLEPYFSVFFLLPIIACVLTFLGLFISF